MNNQKALAAHFVSFLIQNLSPSELDKINTILLHGSVARNEQTPQSDIDIFIDTDTRLSTKVKDILERFYGSEPYRYWKLLGVRNVIKIICDRLSSYPDLRKSIVNDGITLFEKYKQQITENNPYTLIWWDAIKNQSKRVLLSKQMYGYKLKNKEHPGLFTKNWQRLGPNTILVPLSDTAKTKELFTRHDIPFKQKMINKIE